MPSERNQTELAYFQRLVLGMIAELSPCSEQQLLDLLKPTALSDVRKLIRQCVNELQEKGFVEIKESKFVITDTGKRFLQTQALLLDEPLLQASDFQSVAESRNKDLDIVLGERVIVPMRSGELPQTDCLFSLTREAVPDKNYAWLERHMILPSSKLGWLVENIPRRMRAHVSVEAEVRVASIITPRFTANLVGQGEASLHEIKVSQAMSLRLSAPRGGFSIEAQSPETQWVWKNTPRPDELAAWRFTLTPTKRGPNILRLSFSYKEVGPAGLLADSTLPDRVLDIIVTTNVAKTCGRAAIWGGTIIVAAAAGAYFQPAVQFIAKFY